MCLLAVLSYELYPENDGPRQFSDVAERREHASEVFRQAVEPARQIFEASGHSVELAHRFGFPSDEILLEIDHRVPDLVVMGRWWPRRSRDKRSVGRVVKRVLTHSDIPMLLVLFAADKGSPGQDRKDEGAPVKVLVASNGSPSVERASCLAADILGARPAEVTVLTVLPQEAVPSAPQRARDGWLEAAGGPRAAFENRGKTVGVRERFGSPAEEVAREIQETSPDLVVMGKWQGISRRERWVLGTVFERVIRQAHQPILLAQ